MLRWRLFLEEYGVQFHYIKGETNHMADALSRLPFEARQRPLDLSVEGYDPFKSTEDPLPDKADPLHAFYSMATEDNDLLDCFFHLPMSEGLPFQLGYPDIAAAQGEDAHLQQLAQDEPHKYARQLLAPNAWVHCYVPLYLLYLLS